MAIQYIVRVLSSRWKPDISSGSTVVESRHKGKRHANLRFRALRFICLSVLLSVGLFRNNVPPVIIE